jgi:hypothetical protein
MKEANKWWWDGDYDVTYYINDVVSIFTEYFLCTENTQ